MILDYLARTTGHFEGRTEQERWQAREWLSWEADHITAVALVRHSARFPRCTTSADQIVAEADQILSGIGLISNAGARFEAPETISAEGRFEDVHRGEYDPEQHLKDMALDGVAGEVLYPSQGLFYFKVADTGLMSAIFRAYNDWLAEFDSSIMVGADGLGIHAPQDTNA